MKPPVKILLEVVDKELKRLAFDANLYDRGLANYPHSKTNSEKRKKLKEARQWLLSLEVTPVDTVSENDKHPLEGE